MDPAKNWAARDVCLRSGYRFGMSPGMGMGTGMSQNPRQCMISQTKGQKHKSDWSGDLSFHFRLFFFIINF